MTTCSSPEYLGLLRSRGIPTCGGVKSGRSRLWAAETLQPQMRVMSKMRLASTIVSCAPPTHIHTIRLAECDRDAAMRQIGMRAVIKTSND